MTGRAQKLHTARVLLAEAAKRRHSRFNRKFYWTLIAWARNARIEASRITERDLFGALVGSGK